MSKNASPERVFVIGCQRSGTTMVRLVLECHSQVYCFDELLAYKVLAGGSISAPQSARRLVFKIPRWTEQLLQPVLWDAGLPEQARRFYEGEKIIFLLRDVRDAIVSMSKLSAGAKSWLETFPPMIIASKAERDSDFRETYADDLAKAAASEYPPVATGALYWKYKTASLFQYLQHGLPVLPVCYEDLVSQPGPVLKKVCQFLDIPWEEGLLDHPRFTHSEIFESGRAVGETDPRLNIHARSIGQWRKCLNGGQLAEIDRIAGPVQESIRSLAIVRE